MKMEVMVVNATADGVIGNVEVSGGDQIGAGDLICTINPSEAKA